jgi:hypothetical protein
MGTVEDVRSLEYAQSEASQPGILGTNPGCLSVGPGTTEHQPDDRYMTTDIERAT